MKAIVVASGDAAPDDAVLLGDADLVIAADGGATWLAAMGATPDVVVGDMDSVDAGLLERLVAAGATVERHPVDKDASDAELAVERAVAAGADEVLILGALGGTRVDHELANLLLLAHDRWGSRRLRAVRAGTTVRALHGGDLLELLGTEGDVVSLLSVDGDAVGVRARGLRFGLEGETLPLGGSRGISNVVEHSPASVSLERGTLLVIESRKESDR